MDIRKQRQLYKIIKELGYVKTEELLTSFLEDESFEMHLEDELSLLFICFSGWFNKQIVEHDLTNEVIIKGFIQYNLDKGAKNFEKQKKIVINQEFREEWKKRFGEYPNE